MKTQEESWLLSKTVSELQNYIMTKDTIERGSLTMNKTKYGLKVTSW